MAQYGDTAGVYGGGEPYRVMIVDDSAVVRGLQTRVLEADPAIQVVASVDTGLAAVTALDRYTVDVVVLDIEMPVMDGLTALPKLLEKQPGLKVIMSSTLTQKNADISFRAMELGATDYIPKPTSSREITGEGEFRTVLVEKVKALGAAARRMAMMRSPEPSRPFTAQGSVAALQGGAPASGGRQFSAQQSVARQTHTRERFAAPQRPPSPGDAPPAPTVTFTPSAAPVPGTPRPTPEPTISERVIPERLAPDRPMPERPSFHSERQFPERLAVERPSYERPTTERPAPAASERSAPERSVPERPAFERPAVERPAPAAERPSVERPSVERPARPAPAAAPARGATPATGGSTLFPSAPPITLRNPGNERPDVLLIGSSTGGPQALFTVLTALQKAGGVSQPILITQHMPATFTTILADHITRQSGIPAKEGQDGEKIEGGRIYVAPGDYHMTVEVRGGDKIIRLDQGPPENFCRPAVDPMFRTASKAWGRRVLAVVLTGMGSDGSRGGKLLVEAGGTLIAQDEPTSVVWGMPGAAAMTGMCSAVLPINDVAPWIHKFANRRAGS